jgi:hypothetical protein
MSKPTPVTKIEVTLNDMSLTVSPWTAYVERNTDIEWTVQGADDITIEPKDSSHWPFPVPVPGKPPAGRPGTPFAAGKVAQSAPLREHYSYNIILSHDGRKIKIDPDIIIFDPKGT